MKIEQTLRQLVRQFTEVNPKGMSVNEMVDFLVDQMAEMRKEPANQARLRELLQDACGTCNELFLHNGKGFRCNCIRYSTHSHQDYTPTAAVKKGLMRVVEVTPQNVLTEMEKFFVVNPQADRKDWIAYICKALGKTYKKSAYLN